PRRKTEPLLVAADNGDGKVGGDRAVEGDDLDARVGGPLQRRHRSLLAERRDADGAYLLRGEGIDQGDLFVERPCAARRHELHPLLRCLLLHPQLNQLEELVVLEPDAGNPDLARRLRGRGRRRWGGTAPPALRRTGTAAGGGEHEEQGESRERR